MNVLLLPSKETNVSQLTLGFNVIFQVTRRVLTHAYLTLAWVNMRRGILIIYFGNEQKLLGKEQNSR